MKYLLVLATFLGALAGGLTGPVVIEPSASLRPEEAGQVVVLIYHHLAPPSERPEEPGVITPERFESHLAMLRAEGYYIASATEFAAFLDGRLALPARTVLITFDDGYASNYHLGLPLLRQYRAPALIFPVMKYFDSNGLGAYSPHLTREQAAAMLASGLIAFGSHTYDGHHMIEAGPESMGPFLSTPQWISAEGRAESTDEFRQRVRADLERSAHTLRSLGVTEEALHFAVPWGYGAAEQADLLRELGFRYIYTVDDSKPNRAGQPGLVHRLDAGSPAVDAATLKWRLDALFAR